MGRARSRVRSIAVYLVGLVALQVVGVLAIIGFAAVRDFQHARTDARDVMQTTSKAAAHYLSEDVSETKDSVKTAPDLWKVLTTQQICDAQQQSEATNTDDNRYLGSTVYFYGPNGVSACVGGRKDPVVAAAEWFKAAVASDEPISRGHVADPRSGRLSTLDAFYLPDHHVVIVITTDLSTIGKVLNAQFKSSHLRPSFLITTADRTMKLGGDTALEINDPDRIAASTTMPVTGWRVYASVSTRTAFATARSELGQRVVMMIALMFVVLAAAILIHRRLVRPILELGKVTKHISEGDETATVEPSGPKELAELGASFNAMITSVREVDQMRNAFLMAISHELRTPLTSVVGYAEFLDSSLDSLTADEIASSVRSIRGQSQRLERLLMDLLDVERLSRGTIEPRRVDTNLASVVDSAIERLDLHDRVHTNIRPHLHASVDPALVERILENLLVNAVKHAGDAAQIWVTAGRRGSIVDLVVEDNGHGVPDHLKTKIFEVFEQGADEHHSGTGVGLTLVSRFSKLHGGRAWVEDRPGGGASFHVELIAEAISDRPSLEIVA